MGDLIRAFEGDCIARCNCGGTHWELLVNKPGAFEEFLGVRCVYCEVETKFKMNVIDWREGAEEE
tara:strand:- start:150 stop:344 length:195 start_codon:yes stop_codon:yes gene_type:complete